MSAMAQTQQATRQSTDSQLKSTKAVHCPECDFKIYDGEVVRSRCFKLHESKALCRCKEWVDIS